MTPEQIIAILNSHKHRFDMVDWCGASPRALEWRADTQSISLWARNPLSQSWARVQTHLLTVLEAQSIAIFYSTQDGLTDYDLATLARYSETRKILVIAEELDGLSSAALVAIKNGDRESASRLAKQAAGKALILLECKTAIEKIFVQHCGNNG